MREVPVLVWISVLIVAGIGIWLATGASLPFFGAQPAVVQPANDAQLDDAQTDATKKVETAKLVKKAAVHAAKTTPPVAPAPEPAVVLPVAEVVIAPPVPAPAPRRFPSANEIPIGTERENISERFGEPSLATTTTSDNGRVRETMVYSRKSGRDVTVISIEDGKVLSAYSR